MKFSCLGLTVTLLVITTSLPLVCGGNFRVLGGQSADVANYTTLGYITVGGKGPEHIKCGCEIIGSYWVLTSVQCIQAERMSEYTVFNAIGDKESSIEQIIPNPSFHVKHKTRYFDLLLVKTKVDLKKEVGSAATLSISNENFPQLHFAGFGQTNVLTISKKPFFQSADIPVIPDEKCAELYKDVYNLTKDHICTGFEEGGVGPCGSDAGSSLYAEKKDSTGNPIRLLVGVASMSGPGKCGKHPSVYAEVIHEIDWIKRYVPDLQVEERPIVTTTTEASMSTGTPGTTAKS